jgi:hypothetical protein
MNGAALLADVREAMATELDRLGAEKSLLAATEARLEPDPVLVTAATVLATARDTLRGWERAATDEPASEALAGAADTFAAAFEQVAADLDDGDTGPENTATAVADLDAPFLALDADEDPARVGAGTVGVPLVLDRLFLQMVSFFVNEADEARADLFRELREEMDSLLADGEDALDALCTDEDWEVAEAGAVDVVEAAYDDYASRLDAMGFDPKPIC